MAFNVRVYGHRGMSQLPVTLPKQFSSDATYALSEPYEWAQTLVASGAAVSSASQGVGDKTKILRIEVPAGAAVRYEINPPNRAGGAVVANAGSPSMDGVNLFEFEQGWTISIIDAAALP